jgi:hypothetical protein
MTMAQAEFIKVQKALGGVSYPARSSATCCASSSPARSGGRAS